MGRGNCRLPIHKEEEPDNQVMQHQAGCAIELQASLYIKHAIWALCWSPEEESKSNSAGSGRTRYFEWLATERRLRIGASGATHTGQGVECTRNPAAARPGTCQIQGGTVWNGEGTQLWLLLMDLAKGVCRKQRSGRYYSVCNWPNGKKGSGYNGMTGA